MVKMNTKQKSNQYLMKDKYIFVYQDVRGRYMSEGTFTNMTPQVEENKKDVDESTDTYDTIDWLLKNIKDNNGKVGQFGTSYPGFYTAVGILAQHPALPPLRKHRFLISGMMIFFTTEDLCWAISELSCFRRSKTKPEQKAWYMDSL
jgi:hypothetical protein